MLSNFQQLITIQSCPHVLLNRQYKIYISFFKETFEFYYYIEIWCILSTCIFLRHLHTTKTLLMNYFKVLILLKTTKGQYIFECFPLLKH